MGSVRRIDIKKRGCCYPDNIIILKIMIFIRFYFINTIRKCFHLLCISFDAVNGCIEKISLDQYLSLFHVTEKY